MDQIQNIRWWDWVYLLKKPNCDCQCQSSREERFETSKISSVNVITICKSYICLCWYNITKSKPKLSIEIVRNSLLFRTQLQVTLSKHQRIISLTLELTYRALYVSNPGDLEPNPYITFRDNCNYSNQI